MASFCSYWANGAWWWLPLLCLSGCSFFKPPIALQIGDERWNERQFTTLLKQKIKESSLQDNINEQNLKKLKARLISDLMMQKVITRWAAGRQIKVSPGALKAELKKAESGYMHPSALKIYLSKKQIPPARWKALVRYKLLAEKNHATYYSRYSGTG